MRENIFAAIIYISTFVALSTPIVWPPEYQQFFNSIFISEMILLITTIAIILYLYYHGGSSQGSHFIFSVLIILSAAIMYTGFELISTNIEKLKPALQQNYPTLTIIYQQFTTYTKNVIAFGIAAIGASLAANVISSRFKPKS